MNVVWRFFFLLVVVLVIKTKGFPHARQVPYLVLNWITLPVTVGVQCPYQLSVNIADAGPTENSLTQSQTHKADNILVVLMCVLVTFSFVMKHADREGTKFPVAYNSRGAQSTAAGKACWQDTKWPVTLLPHSGSRAGRIAARLLKPFPPVRLCS